MSTVVVDGEIEIPGWIVDHESFRRWAHSDEFPERGRYSFVDGKIWADLTGEEFFTHNQIKGEFLSVLGSLVDTLDLGYFRLAGTLWSNVAAGISTQPDNYFFTYDALRSGRMRLIPGRHGGYTELEGSLNMALEIVSDASERRDVILKDQYARAGVDEFWLVDARGTEHVFQIWRLQDSIYVAAAEADGWLTSTVFGHAFKLERSKDRLGHPEFRLLMR